jgi:hypothetical protein
MSFRVEEAKNPFSTTVYEKKNHSHTSNLSKYASVSNFTAFFPSLIITYLRQWRSQPVGETV